MENLSRADEVTSIPTAIPVPAYLGDHHVSGRVVLPAVEALQILAQTLPADAGVDPRRQERGMFSHLLTIEAGIREIPAVHEITRYADGSCRSRLLTAVSGRQATWTRKIEHVSVFFQPVGIITPATKHVKAVIPAEAGIHKQSGLRIKSGMTFDIFGCRSNNSRERENETAACFDKAAAPEESCFTFSAQRLYDELVPFGPAYWNVVGDVRLSPGGASAAVSGGKYPEATGPLGSPFPFDAAFHVACAWGQRYRGIVAFPVGFDRREIIVPTRAGETYCCRVLPLPDEGTALRFDLLLTDGDGKPAEVIRGVEMRDITRGRIKPPTWVGEGI
jgi:hypothetical protein